MGLADEQHPLQSRRDRLRGADLRMRATKYYVTMTAAERRLALIAMLRFRNKAIAQGIDTVDIDQLIQSSRKNGGGSDGSASF